MAATPSTTDDQGFDGRTSDDPPARGGWITRWTDLLFWPWQLPAVVRSVAGQLVSITERSALPTDAAVARLDAVESQLTGRLEQTESVCRRELNAVLAATAALERRIAALEAHPREDAAREDDVPRLPMRSADAFREVLSRAGEMAAQRGLTRNSGSSTVVSDHGPDTHAEVDAPARPSRKAPRGRGRRS